MYDFIDVTEAQSGMDMPSEALRINGEFLETQIEGYRTLYVAGREMLAPEVAVYETGLKNGSSFKSRRYPARTITVGYQLVAKSNRAFREAYNKLNSILDVEDAELIFNDEPDKFFIGTPCGMGEIEPGKNAVKGEIEFLCVDPFKYSVKEYEAVPSPEDGTFVIDYKGTYKSFPTLEVDFYEDESGEENDNGRCGYVAFFNENEKILQFGNPEELKEEEIEVVNIETNTYLVPTTKVLLNHTYKKSNGWSSVKTKYSNGGVIYKGPFSGVVLREPIVLGIVGAGHSYETNEEGTYYLMPSNFGANDLWHGPAVTYTFSESAADFEFTYSQKLCIGGTKADKKQCGAFQMILSDSYGRIIAGVYISKWAEGANGAWGLLVNGMVLSASNLDLSFHNKYFGSNRDENKKENKKAIKTVKSSSITKNGSEISFNIGGIKRVFKVDAVKSAEVKRVTVLFLQKGNLPPFKYSGVYGMKMVKNYKESVTEKIEKITTEWHDVQNKFNANDVLTVDCSCGSVKLNGLERPDLGAMGNDWEGFCLENGINQIGVSYSDWVGDAYAPSFKIRYREVFL